MSDTQRNSSSKGTAGRPNSLGVAVLYLLILAAILAMLFVSPPEAARVVRLA